MQLPVYTKEGVPTGAQQALADAVFGVEPNAHTMYQAVTAEQAHRRHGTRSTKTRGEVSGANRKLFRQKGTGNARAGMLRTNVRVGGGRAHGPRPHAYSYALPKKVKALARSSALTTRIRENAMFVVEDFTLDAPRTKSVARLFNTLGVTGHRILFVTSAPSPALVRSCRNLPNVVVRHGNAFSTQDILGCQRLVIQQGALPQIGNTGAHEGSGTSDSAPAGH